MSKTYSSKRPGLILCQFVFLSFVAMLYLTACGGETPASHEHSHAHYVCPMHPQIVREEAGSCPICGMDLVEKHIEPDGDEQSQAHYVCPMHPQIVRDEAGSCPICGMNLVEKHIEPDGDEQSHAHYVCPMHPQIVREEAGSCPICGMDLVKKHLETSEGDRPKVTLGASVVQNMGVRTAKVKRGVLQRHIHTQGTVTYDEDRIIKVHPRTPGWIETLDMRTDGETVKRKDELAQFFSPLIVQLQLSYIEALDALDLAKMSSTDTTEANLRVKSLRNSLKLLHVMPMDIMSIENHRTVKDTIPIIAPQGGVVTKLGVREGMYVEPEDTMFTIVDLDHMWVMVDIYEHQMSWIKPGLNATIKAPALRDRSWEGKIDFIYPEVDPKSRTLRARIAVKNQNQVLVPNMYVDVTIATAPKNNVLIVPRETVIPTGERETVIKAQGNGHFQPVEVTSGMWVGPDVEIISGLKENDEVVVSGQFLIDSESSLQADFSRMAE